MTPEFTAEERAALRVTHFCFGQFQPVRAVFLIGEAGVQVHCADPVCATRQNPAVQGRRIVITAWLFIDILERLH